MGIYAMKKLTFFVFLSYLIISPHSHAGGGGACAPVTQEVGVKDKIAWAKRKFKISRINGLNDKAEALTNVAFQCSECTRATFSYLELEQPYSETVERLTGNVIPKDEVASLDQAIYELNDEASDRGLTKRVTSRRNLRLAAAGEFMDARVQPGRSTIVATPLDVEEYSKDGVLTKTYTANHEMIVMKGTEAENPSYTVIEMRGRVRFDAARDVKFRDVLFSNDKDRVFFYEYPIEEGGRSKLFIRRTSALDVGLIDKS